VKSSPTPYTSASDPWIVVVGANCSSRNGLIRCRTQPSSAGFAPPGPALVGDLEKGGVVAALGEKDDRDVEGKEEVERGAAAIFVERVQEGDSVSPST
jgi:hypothetical protein